MNTPTTEEKARALIRGVVMAIRTGHRHYNRAGVLLDTPRAVMECLLCEGEVQVVTARMNVQSKLVAGESGLASAAVERFKA